MEENIKPVLLGDSPVIVEKDDQEEVLEEYEELEEGATTDDLKGI